MTQKDLHSQELVRQAEEAVIRMQSRRHFLKDTAMGLGALAMGTMFGSCRSKSSLTNSSVLFDPAHPLMPKLPHFAGEAKSVIYLHMAGAPSQLELFDYKPELMKMDGQDCPPSLLEGNDLHLSGVFQKCWVRRQSLRNTEPPVPMSASTCRISLPLLMR